MNSVSDTSILTTSSQSSTSTSVSSYDDTALFDDEDMTDQECIHYSENDSSLISTGGGRTSNFTPKQDAMLIETYLKAIYIFGCSPNKEEVRYLGIHMISSV